MRRFHSYGPVDKDVHFCVERRELVDQCINQLIGQPDKGGHYFTIWAARQTGKTWLMRQAMEEISQRYGDQFIVQRLSFGGFDGAPAPISSEREKNDLPLDIRNFLKYEFPGKPDVTTWDEFQNLFSKEGGSFDRPVILLIDEVDTMPSPLLDMVVRRFRELYLRRTTNWLHGLALVGVRAVVGIESQHGSPFNIQRSLHVPNLTPDEVREMYQQYQTESGQAIDPAVVDKVYEVTRGQPGLVSWFGELLTETYNPTPPYSHVYHHPLPGPIHPIAMETWRLVWRKARVLEPNNTVMNLIAKARMPEYQPFLIEVFSKSNIPFSFHDPIQNYLYMHGILATETVANPNGEEEEVCRFTSPFVQECLYTALSRDLTNDTGLVLKLDPLDRLTDVTAKPTLHLPALLDRYKGFLLRLKAKGINPWKDQPRRATDLHLTEAVGHFHLYAWLQGALGRTWVISPEFPTGNGKVDLHIRYGEKRGIIEVKSFVNALELDYVKWQAAHYAKQMGLDCVTLAVFIPVEDETVLAALSTTEVIDGMQVFTVAIGWV